MNHGGVDDRLSRNAVALVGSSVITSLIGVVFWLAAARLFTQPEVGQGAALITVLTLLASLATLGLGNAFVRFIPVSGTAARSFILRSYALCSVAAIVIAAGFLAGIHIWADGLSFVVGSSRSIIFFLLGTVGWTLFALQDNVLTGLRAATWIPVENAIYSVVKLAALFLLAGTGPMGFAVAWVVPAALTLAPVTWLMLRRIETERFTTRPPSALFARSAIIRFAAGDQAADLLRVIGAEMVVLIVLAKRGASASASFFLATTIATSLTLFAINVANAFTAEAATRPHEEHSLLRRSLRHAGGLVAPAALVTAAGAPVVMGLFGPQYATDGATVLRILAVGTLPNILVALGIGVARLHRRIGLVSVLYGASALGPIIGAAFLSDRWGLKAIAWSTVVGSTLVAAVLLATLLRPLWTGATMIVTAPAWRARVRTRRTNSALAGLLDELDSGHSCGARLLPRRVIDSDAEGGVVLVDRPHEPVLVRVAFTADAIADLRNHVTALDDIWQRVPTGTVLPIPRVGQRGMVQGSGYAIETACPGRPPLVADFRVTAAAMRALRAVHELTVQQHHAETMLLRELIDDPIASLGANYRLAPHRHMLEHVRRELRAALVGRPVHTARTHGDCWPGRFMVEAGPDGPRITGIVGWEHSSRHSLADLDAVYYWLATQTGGLSRAVEHGLATNDLAELLAASGVEPFDPDLPAGLGVLLAWLAYVDNGLHSATGYSASPEWLDRNVVQVLHLVTARSSLFHPQPLAA